MSFFVPKTAWRATNINKRYGLHALGLQPTSGLDWEVPKGFDTANPTSYVSASGAGVGALQKSIRSGNGLFTTLSNTRMILDVRSDADRRRRPIPNIKAAFGNVRLSNIHVDDLTSGAANRVLPYKKAESLVVVASSDARSHTAFNALRRHGYHNVSVMNDVVLMKALEKAYAAEQPATTTAADEVKAAE